MPTFGFSTASGYFHLLIEPLHLRLSSALFTHHHVCRWQLQVLAYGLQHSLLDRVGAGPVPHGDDVLVEAHREAHASNHTTHRRLCVTAVQLLPDEGQDLERAVPTESHVARLVQRNEGDERGWQGTAGSARAMCTHGLHILKRCASDEWC